MSSETAIPVQNNYESPQTLGRDRIAVVVAAAELYPNENFELSKDTKVNDEYRDNFYSK